MCVCVHALVVCIDHSLSKLSVMFTGESSAEALLGFAGFTAVGLDPTRRVGRVSALHSSCSRLPTDQSLERSSLTEEDVFKKPYLSRREGKLNAAEDKARETLRACSLNEQLKAAVNKVPHRRNNNNNN